MPGSTIIDPVYIEDGVAIRDARVGPNVAIGAGSVIENSELRDTIVGHQSQIRKCALRSSLIGDNVLLEGVRGEVSIGDHSEVRETGS